MLVQIDCLLCFNKPSFLEVLIKTLSYLLCDEMWCQSLHGMWDFINGETYGEKGFLLLGLYHIGFIKLRYGNHDVTFICGCPRDLYVELWIHCCGFCGIKRCKPHVYYVHMWVLSSRIWRNWIISGQCTNIITIKKHLIILAKLYRTFHWRRELSNV